jgi:hypothetical protein
MQAAMGFSPLGMAGAIRPAATGAIQALQDQARRIIAGAEGLSGEAKYAALRDIAAKLRSLQGAPEAAPGVNMVPADVQKMRETMERVNAARMNPYQFK